MPNLSVIVPVYNCEKYLGQCIESIINQTYKNYELILVDDGSTDDSGKICDIYAGKFGQIKVLHKVNGGVSSARNLGLLNSTAQFITFIDADDYIADNMLQVLADNIKDVDLSATGFIAFWQNTGKVLPRKLPDVDVTVPVEMNENYSKLENAEFFYALYGKLYKREIIFQNKIFFSEKISILEDRKFVMQYIGVISKIRCVSDCLYTYRQIDEESLVKKYNKNAINALLEVRSVDLWIRECLVGQNKRYYNQLNYSLFSNFLKDIYQKETKEEFEKMLIGLLNIDSIKSLILEAPYDNLKHVKYNIILICFKRRWLRGVKVFYSINKKS